MNKFLILTIGTILTLSACSVEHLQSSPNLGAMDDWVVLPFRNRSQTPLAAERVEALVLSALRAKGAVSIEAVAAEADHAPGLPLIDDHARYAQGLVDAKQQGAKYGVTGSVEEWRYKTGLDGEPAVGLSIRIVDLTNEKTAWSSSAARSGWSRESLTGNGQKVIDNILGELFSEGLWTRL